MHEQLHAARKAANPGGASTKRDDRLQSIDKFVATDAAVPEELFKLMLYYLSIFIFMCRVPFSIVTNVHFMRFLWILRPNFAKKIVPRTLRLYIANDLLDEAYEESTEIAAATLASVPGRLTLGMERDQCHGTLLDCAALRGGRLGPTFSRASSLSNFIRLLPAT